MSVCVKYKYSEVTKKAVIKRVKRGRSMVSIAKEYGMSISTVSRWCNPKSVKSISVIMSNDGTFKYKGAIYKEDLPFLDD